MGVRAQLALGSRSDSNCGNQLYLPGAKAPENFLLKAALWLVLSEYRLQPEVLPPLQRRARMS